MESSAQQHPDDVVLAVDIGGTKMAVCLVTPDGRVLERREAPTAAGDADPERVWEPLAAAVERVVAAVGTRHIVGVGVGSAGPLDLTNGTISPVNIRAWRAFPVVRRLAERLPGVPLRLAGDGICAAAGEHWRGAGRGIDDLLVLVVSTGVGGGLVQGGRLVTGPSGNAGHIGHVVVDLDGGPCACGGRGCVETIASGPSMVAWASRHGWRSRGAATAVELAATARSGDTIAREAFERCGRAIAAGVVSAAALCDLTRVVVGGGVGRAADLLLPPLRRSVREYGRLGFLRGLTIESAGLGGDAGLVGAAALVFAPDVYPVPAH